MRAGLWDAVESVAARGFVTRGLATFRLDGRAVRLPGATGRSACVAFLAAVDFGFGTAWPAGFFLAAGRGVSVRRCLGMSWSNRRRRPGDESGLAALT